MNEYKYNQRILPPPCILRLIRNTLNKVTTTTKTKWQHFSLHAWFFYCPRWAQQTPRRTANT